MHLTNIFTIDCVIMHSLHANMHSYMMNVVSDECLFYFYNNTTFIKQKGSITKNCQK